MSEYQSQIIEAYRSYSKLGFKAVAIVPGGKQPIGSNWTKTDYDEWDFTPIGVGIGVKLGDVSDGLVDLDLDCAEAVAIAERLGLIEGGCSFDRGSKDSAHLLFKCAGATTRTFKAENGSMLLELRANKRNPKDENDKCGAQTVLPPTRHELGELRRWRGGGLGRLRTISQAELEGLASHVAALALLVSYYPSKGDRHNYAMEVRGFLAHAGADDSEIAKILADIAHAANDEEAVERSASSEATKLASGVPITGGPILAKRIGEKNVQKLREWLALGGGGLESVEKRDDKILKSLSDEYAYVLDQEVFVHKEDLTRLSRSQFDALYRAKISTKGSIASRVLYLPGLERLARLDYAPGQPPLFAREGDKLRRINIYRPGPVVPKCGSVDVMLAHYEYLIPDPDFRRWFLDYIAWIIQHPGEKTSFFPLITGKPGTGKSYVAVKLGLILGSKNVVVVPAERLQQRFNSWMVGKTVIVLDELERGDWKFYNTLKPLVTQPDMLVEEKGINQYVMPATFNFFCFSNEEMPMRLTADDRRIAFYSSPAEPKEDAYYDRLFAWTEANTAAILFFFLNRELGNFNPKGRAIRTNDKMQLARQSLDNAAQLILELVETEHPWFAGGLTTTSIVRLALPAEFRGWTDRRTSVQMRAAGMLPVPGRIQVHGRKVQVFAINAAALEVYENAAPDVIRHVVESACSSPQRAVGRNLTLDDMSWWISSAIHDADWWGCCQTD